MIEDDCLNVFMNTLDNYNDEGYRIIEEALKKHKKLKLYDFHCKVNLSEFIQIFSNKRMINNY